MRPEHKRPNTNWEYAPQFTRDPPFEIKVNTTKVKPGELVEVVLTSKGKYDFFKGYFMQVFEDKSFFSKIIPLPQGSWIPLGRSRTLQCHIYEDSISHTEASYKRNVTMLWRAPMAATHPFKVKATVVRNYTHYWEDIWSPTIYPTEMISIETPPINPNPAPATQNKENEKKDLLESLAKEVGADSAKELLEILRQKVDEKNNPAPSPASTAAPTKTADQKIDELKKNHPDTAKKNRNGRKKSQYFG
ncbi:unnamed protein product [Mytilus edulis]|uniref:Reelin domain-containing protein n=1 Tax=Mytilus edulis TaxID=6550 RepID=A0A8S3QNZ7_MYTED|nr:unnamed protein product [Mytilus edulis]